MLFIVVIFIIWKTISGILAYNVQCTFYDNILGKKISSNIVELIDS